MKNLRMGIKGYAVAFLPMGCQDTHLKMRLANGGQFMDVKRSDVGLNNRNAGFLSTAIFAYLCLYILWCVQKGTVKFGIRVPFCCRLHPMKEN